MNMDTRISSYLFFIVKPMKCGLRISDFSFFSTKPMKFDPRGEHTALCLSLSRRVNCRRPTSCLLHPFDERRALSSSDVARLAHGNAAVAFDQLCLQEPSSAHELAEGLRAATRGHWTADSVSSHSLAQIRRRPCCRTPSASVCTMMQRRSPAWCSSVPSVAS